MKIFAIIDDKHPKNNILLLNALTLDQQKQRAYNCQWFIKDKLESPKQLLPHLAHASLLMLTQSYFEQFHCPAGYIWCVCTDKATNKAAITTKPVYIPDDFSNIVNSNIKFDLIEHYPEKIYIS